LHLADSRPAGRTSGIPTRIRMHMEDLGQLAPRTGGSVVAPAEKTSRSRKGVLQDAASLASASRFDDQVLAGRFWPVSRLAGPAVAHRGCRRRMKKTDIQCPECAAGYRRIELVSTRGKPGAFRCQICNRVLETFDGSTEIAYRLTVVPERMFE